MNKVIVIGSDHHNTLGVLRSLGERGIKSDLLIVTQSKMTFVNYSKYVEKSFIVRQVDEILTILLSQYRDETHKPVLICCSDTAMGIIDENRDELSRSFFLPGSNVQGQISALMNKKEMAKLAESIGLNVPHSTYLENPLNDLMQIKLPCIIKPIESRKGSKKELSICKTFKDIESYSEKYDLQNYQIQDYIDKDFEFQLIGCSTKNEIIIPGVSIIKRPCKGSNTSFLYYSPLKEGFCAIGKCKEFVKRTGYHGLFSLEFLRDKDGQDYFMEINFRNDGNAICVTAAGMSLPYIWYLDCIGEDYYSESKKTISPVYVMPDIAELKLLVTRQISLREYIDDFRKTDRFMEYDRMDEKPFWKLIKFHICSRLHI